ncbi:MAG: TIGR04076 family protein [Candidatus Lokiarchaeota archaeon]|nr:TIGR04076 family protein [Candidatus Lokiarchaeota archaeon]
MSKEVLNVIKKNLGYTEEEMKIFLENKKNIEILEKTPNLINKTIVIEVIESHGCNSQHLVGEKFYFDGSGNLLTKLSPKRICISALAAMDRLIFGATTLMFADQNPNKMLFNKAGCSDIGLKCGGWGNIAMEIKVIDRDNI